MVRMGPSAISAVRLDAKAAFRSYMTFNTLSQISPVLDANFVVFQTSSSVPNVSSGLILRGQT